jgi:hypothetical protein
MMIVAAAAADDDDDGVVVSFLASHTHSYIDTKGCFNMMDFLYSLRYYVL